MARFSLPRLNIALPVVTSNGLPTPAFHHWWQQVVEKLETQENTQDDLIAAIVAAQAAADAAATAAATAATAAADAQVAADAAQATADSIVIPPTGSRTVSSNTALTANDYAVLVDATGGDIDIDLPLSGAVTNGIQVTKIDASANVVNVFPSGADDLNGGGTAVVLTTQYESKTFTADGITDWFG